MAKQRRSELISGIFIVAALAAGVAALVWLGAADALKERGQKAFFAVAQGRGQLGLKVGSAVKFNDAAIGRIKAIHPDVAGERTLYETRLERADILIKADARAKAAASEFIGGASIVLEDFGSAQAPPAGAENPVPLGESTNAVFEQARAALGYGDQQRRQFQDSLAHVAAAAEMIRHIAENVGSQVDPDNAASLLAQIRAVVADLRDGSKNLLAATERLASEADKRQAGSVMQKVHGIADDVGSLAANASGMIRQIRPQVEQTVARVSQYADKDIAAVLADLRKFDTKLLDVVADLKVLIANAKDVVVLNRERLDGIILDMKVMAANLNAAAKEVRRNPWRLLQRPTDRQTHSQNIYDATRCFAEGARQLDDALGRLQLLREARPEGVAADDPELDKILRHVKTSFERFRGVEAALWKELAE